MMRPILTLCALVALVLPPSLAAAAPSEVRLQQDGEKASLLVDGKPFMIKGAGGDASKPKLVAAGANAFRTWGVGDDTQAKLDEAQKLGLKVVVGIWLGHERHGFDYGNADQVAAQFDAVRKAVLKFRDHPAVLAWALGNEMEGYEAGGNAAIWSHVQACAALVKQLDPKHPTMTVVAEIGGQRVPAIHKLCPDIDIVGINSYGGVMSIPERYRAAGGTKPYVVTEFGPPGTWEIGRNSFGAVNEPTSTQKAAVYAKAYQTLAADSLCLGSFAFTWGFKQEATATWYGMFLFDGSKTASVDAMTEAWSGKKPADLCPQIDPLEVSAESVEPGGTIDVKLKTRDPEGGKLKVEWRLHAEAEDYFTGGDHQAEPPSFPKAITSSSLTGATLTMPQKPGKYRVYAFVRDGHGGGAMANMPLLVKGKDTGPTGMSSNLPYVVFGEKKADPNYVPSGYMGDTAFIKVDEESHMDPKVGQTCMKVTFEKDSGWGGVVWQHPVNDWGDQPGGFDMSGATKLTFYARGEEGGEKVKFGFGLLGADAKYSDTASGEVEATLEKGWKAYSVKLTGKDLSRIKTGFYWSLGSPGKPVTFYLDEIKFE